MDLIQSLINNNTDNSNSEKLYTTITNLFINVIEMIQVLIIVDKFMNQPEPFPIYTQLPHLPQRRTTITQINSPVSSPTSSPRTSIDMDVVIDTDENAEHHKDFLICIGRKIQEFISFIASLNMGHKTDHLFSPYSSDINTSNISVALRQNYPNLYKNDYPNCNYEAQDYNFFKEVSTGSKFYVINTDLFKECVNNNNCNNKFHKIFKNNDYYNIYANFVIMNEHITQVYKKNKITVDNNVVSDFVPSLALNDTYSKYGEACGVIFNLIDEKIAEYEYETIVNNFGSRKIYKRKVRKVSKPKTIKRKRSRKTSKIIKRKRSRKTSKPKTIKRKRSRL